jgi:mycobactin peptide synthetase MbtE
MLLAEELLPGAADNMVILAFPVSGTLRLGELEAAVGDVVNRHEALRTVLVWQGSGAGQQVLPPSRVPAPALPIQDYPGRGSLPGGDSAEAVAEQACSHWWDRPFDLTSSPPFRFQLVRLEPERHLLCVGFHHIAADGWAGRLIGADIGAAYLARLAGNKPADWPRGPVPGPAAYAAWQATQFPAWRAEDLPFWRSVMATPGHPVLGRADATSEGACVSHRRPVPPELARSYLELSRRGRLGRFVRAAVQSLTESFTAAEPGQTGRMRLGTLTSGRSEPRFRETVGTFVNPVLLPVDASDPAGPLPGALLRRCLEHSRTPFDEVVRVLPATARANPYAVLVTLDDWSAAPGSRSPLARGAIAVQAPRTCTGLSLTLTVEHDGRMAVVGRWRAGVVDDGTGRRLVNSLTTLAAR